MSLTTEQKLQILKTDLRDMKDLLKTCAEQTVSSNATMSKIKFLGRKITELTSKDDEFSEFLHTDAELRELGAEIQVLTDVLNKLSDE